jgi:hypothetical protein
MPTGDEESITPPVRLGAQVVPISQHNFMRLPAFTGLKQRQRLGNDVDIAVHVQTVRAQTASRFR